MSAPAARAPGGLSAAQRSLMGGWLDIGDAINGLAAEVNVVRTTCSCPPVAGHTSCPCCHDDPQRAACSECHAVLERVAARMAALVDAMIRFMPITRAVVESHAGDDGRRRLSTLVTQVTYAEGALSRIETHSGEFRQGCSLAYIDTLEDIVTKLQAGVRGVNELR